MWHPFTIFPHRKQKISVDNRNYSFATNMRDIALTRRQLHAELYSLSRHIDAPAFHEKDMSPDQSTPSSITESVQPESMSTISHPTRKTLKTTLTAAEEEALAEPLDGYDSDREPLPKDWDYEAELVWKVMNEPDESERQASNPVADGKNTGEREQPEGTETS